ncbi:TrmH family RNA methyltransferase [Chloroflexota bacterium]
MSTPLKPLTWYKKLASRKERLEAGAFLVEGERAIRQLAGTSPGEIIEIVATGETPPVYSAYPSREVTKAQFNSISQTITPQGILAVVRLPANVYSPELPADTGKRILLLEDIQDPGNVGTLIRTAAAFDYSGIIMTEDCADPFSPKAVQSTAGTVMSLWIRRTDRYLDMAGALKKGGFTLVAADLDGTGNTGILQDSEKLLLALGNEAAGLSQPLLDIADCRLRIPVISEKAESLNVAACSAICMYLSSA